MFVDNGRFSAATCFLKSQEVRDVNMNSHSLLHEPINFIMALFCFWLTKAALQTYCFRFTIGTCQHQACKLKRGLWQEGSRAEVQAYRDMLKREEDQWMRDRAVSSDGDFD